MRPQRMYDPHKQFYALVSFKYAGVDYKRGDKFDIGEMPSRRRVQFFQNWYIGYSEDFRTNKAAIKEVEIDTQPTEKKIEEFSTQVKSEEEPVQQEESKPQKKTRRKYTKKSDTSSD